MWLPLIILLLVLVPAIIYIVAMEMQLLLITIFLLGVVFLFTQLADTFFGGSELLAILAILITAIPIFLLYRRWRHSKERVTNKSPPDSPLNN